MTEEEKKKAPAKKPAAKKAPAKKAAAKPAAEKKAPAKKTATKKTAAPKAAAKAAEPKKEAAPKAEAKPKAAPKKSAAANSNKADGKIRVRQIGSPLGRKKDQRLCLIGLGLNKMNRERVLEDTPSIRGMINKVKHLVEVEAA